MADGKIIEIAGTTITENVSGNYEMFAENIVSNAGKTVHETGKEIGKTHGKPGEAPVLDAAPIEAKCIVQFRPHANYNGEYGFDWVRFGDTGFKGDTWYRNIIGKIVYKDQNDFLGHFVKDVSKYGSLLRSFKNLIIPWKGKIKGNPYLYTQVVMTLWEGSTAKLTLKVEIEEKPEKLVIRQRKAKEEDPDYFTFNVTEVTIKENKYDLKDFLEITCSKSFDTDQFIEVYAVVGEEEVLAGCLKVLKNSVLHQKTVKILMVNITTAEGACNLAGEGDRVKKFLRQAYIHAEISSFNMNLTNTKSFNDEFSNGESKFNNNLDVQTRLYTRLKNTKFGNGVVGNRYENYYRVFFTKKVLGDNVNGYLLGEVDSIPGNNAIILDTRGVARLLRAPLSTVNNTVAHEFFHLLGLYHTFDGGSKYVFKQYHTDNVMDYTTKKTNIKGIYSFKWQWPILQAAAKMKKSK